MDIYSKSEGPAGKLSNFTRYFFMFDGVPCACPEGPIQAFKCCDFSKQQEICLLDGRSAKEIGQTFNEEFQRTQLVWWRGRSYPRQSQEYQELIDLLYSDLSKNRLFRETLLLTGSEVLTHSIGKANPRETILTEEEFCSRLMNTRKRLQWEELEQMDLAAKIIHNDGVSAAGFVSENFDVETAAILVKASQVAIADKDKDFTELSECYGSRAAKLMLIARMRRHFSARIFSNSPEIREKTINAVLEMI